MFLQSHRAFDSVADYDPAINRLDVFSRQVQPSRVVEKISGSFDHLGGKQILLYREDETLYIVLDGERRPMAQCVVDVRRAGQHNYLRIHFHGDCTAEIAYAPPPVDEALAAADDDPFIEKEDFDFGILLQNVSRDPARQQRMYRGE